jgi:hypothetical protein
MRGKTDEGFEAKRKEKEEGHKGQDNKRAGRGGKQAQWCRKKTNDRDTFESRPWLCGTAVHDG